MKDSLSWPPSYQIRKSKRAKRVSLVIKPGGRLELVQPYFLRHFDPTAFIEQSRDWIMDKLMKIRATQSSVSFTNSMPSVLPLTAVEQDWKIITQPSAIDAVRVSAKTFLELTLVGQVDDPTLCRAAIKKWLQQKAKKTLPAWLESVSKQCGLGFNRCRINVAKTRWGSCSSQKNISLNAKLLLLPPALVEHTMLHELCHTVHLNHSADFWDLLHSLDPETHKHRQLIRTYHDATIHWLE